MFAVDRLCLGAFAFEVGGWWAGGCGGGGSASPEYPSKHARRSDGDSFTPALGEPILNMTFLSFRFDLGVFGHDVFAFVGCDDRSDVGRAIDRNRFQERN